MRAVGHRYTWHDYLMLEQSSNVRHEYFDGEIFAMAGGTPLHPALAVRIASLLDAQLEGTRCRVFNSDLRVRVLSTGLGTYPDVSVVYGELQRDPEDASTIVNPTVIVEVLSDSTEAYDRTDKYANYKLIPTLREYVLVSHRDASIEIFRRSAEGQWERLEARKGARATLESIQCVLDVDRVYSGVELHSPG
jgi:Uma2 family endonuclease